MQFPAGVGSICVLDRKYYHANILHARDMLGKGCIASSYYSPSRKIKHHRMADKQ